MMGVMKRREKEEEARVQEKRRDETLGMAGGRLVGTRVCGMGWMWMCVDRCR
jgi:hypothetical protein